MPKKIKFKPELVDSVEVPKITLGADPTENMHAVTKQYVDNLQGLIPKINIHTGSPDDLDSSFTNATEGDIVIIVSPEEDPGEDSGEEA